MLRCFFACVVLSLSVFVNSLAVANASLSTKEINIVTLEAKQGHAAALFGLGTLYAFGHGVRQDIHKAKEFFGQACDKGDQFGCDQYRKLNQQGY